MWWIPLLWAAPDDVDYEIVVYGEEAERQARWDVIIGLKRLGWEPVDATAGRTIFKPPRRWLGRAVLEPDGTLNFRYRALAFKKVGLNQPMAVDPNPHFANEPGMMLANNDGTRANTLPAGEAGLWLLPSKALVSSVIAKTREAVREETEQYDRIRRDTEVRRELDALPLRLDALWEDGVPLEGSAVLQTPQQRKLHVLAFWASRSATFEGRQVTRATEIWIANTIQDSDSPVTEAERTKAESMRADGRPLTL